MENIKNNNNGFTLLEVMIAIAIFSIGILALANLQLRSGRSNSSARIYSDSVAVGQHQIELLMTVPWTSANLTGAGNNNPITINSNGQALIYTSTWDVTDIDLNGDGINDFKDIDLTVRDPNGQVGFTTFFSRAISFAN